VEHAVKSLGVDDAGSWSFSMYEDALAYLRDIEVAGGARVLADTGDREGMDAPSEVDRIVARVAVRRQDSLPQRAVTRKA
jgi:hypothetical protein